jgi:hypothetical protein
VLIFLHLPKTAGTTLAHILARQYGDAALLRLYESTSGEELASIPRSQLDGVRVVLGHFSFGAHRFIPYPTPYITVLREPIARVISHYSFVRRSPTHYLYDTARRLSLGEFVVACGLDEPNNDQTRLLAGYNCGPASVASAEEMLARARQHLRDYVAVAGLTEDFDRSILLMKHAFGWKTPYYARENVSGWRLPWRGVSDETLGVIAAHNQLDLELYHFAQGIFQGQVIQHGAELESELRRFKRLNALLGRLYGATRLPIFAHQKRRQ